jgi:FixJ family two-component response regulator
MVGEQTVFVVDDDEGVRRSLQLVLASVSLRARTFASAEEFERGYAGEEELGCVILDLRMPGMSGLELLARLRSRGAEVPVIILTGEGEVQTVVRSMKLGATDYLEKPADPAALVARVREALCMAGARRQGQAARGAARLRLARLTARERELLDLVVNGFSNKQIAAKLGLSIKTVANHRAHLIAKMEAVNTADLVRVTMMGGAG